PAGERGEDPVAEPGRGPREGKPQAGKSPVEEEQMEQRARAQDVDEGRLLGELLQRRDGVRGKGNRTEQLPQQPAGEGAVAPAPPWRHGAGRGNDLRAGRRVRHGATLLRAPHLSVWSNRGTRRALPARRPPCRVRRRARAPGAP